MKSIRFLLALAVASFVTTAFVTAQEQPKKEETKAKCCVKAEKNGEKCTHECCATAAKDGKNCEKCGGANAPAKK